MASVFSVQASLEVLESNASEGTVLFSTGEPADIFLDTNCAPSVVRACGDLAQDVNRVVGLQPDVVRGFPGPSCRIIIGTLGAGGVVDQIAAKGALDTNGISGQWESYVLQVVKYPTATTGVTLVIAGSDPRGTIYGMYQLSEMMGVSPWYWWADVPVKKKSLIAVSGDLLKQGPPPVKFRGIFLNDEDYCLRPWAANTFEPEHGNIGPKTYEKIFELLLRLRANLLWPAMHQGTAAFNSFPENRELADRYGIVMGSSHCEQMLRNNVSEWKTSVNGEYNFVTNPDGVLKYWEERVKENGRYENLYTLGMRGVHDGAMTGGGTDLEKANRLREIIAGQRDILSKDVNTNLAAVPQIFCPYKEVLGLYRLMPDLPEDVTLVWPDDNYGYIRQFSNPSERKRSGGAGVYYHISYWGAPYNYLWLCSTPPGLIAEEMTKAFDLGADRVWVVNVGDLKPGEIGAEYFLRLAWAPHRWIEDNPGNELVEMLCRDFGRNSALELASILNEYYRLSFQRKPEHMGFDKNSPWLDKPVFSSALNGDEVEQRLQAWRILVSRTDSASGKLPHEYQDAFYELIGYPVKAAAAMNDKGLLLTEFLNHRLEGRTDADAFLSEARKAQERINILTAYYNVGIAGGKWKGMMSDHPGNQAVFAIPDFTEPPSTNQPEPFGLVVEGCETPVFPQSTNAQECRLPQFNSLVPRTYFVDVFNGTGKPWIWTADARQDWIMVTPSSGGVDARVMIGVNMDKAPSGDNVKGQVVFSSGGRKITLGVSLNNPSHNPAVEADFTESDGLLVIQAEHASRFVSGSDAAWKVIPNLGYNYGVVTAIPATAAARETPEDVAAGSPRLEYKTWLTHAGEWRVHVRTLPTFSIEGGKPQRYAVSFDNAPPQIVELPSASDGKDRAWQEDVLRNAAVTTSVHIIPSRGFHTLKLWMVDPGIVFDCVAANCGQDRPLGYVWPMETRIMCEK